MSFNDRPGLLLEDYVDQSVDALLQVKALAAEFKEATSVLADVIRSSRKILWCGNGGSAADAQHLSAELVGRCAVDGRPISSIALSTDTSALTAIANDYDFADVFSRQVEALAQEGDALVCLSTSGNSRNVVRAAEQARSMGVFTLAFTGGDGGQLAECCDLVLTAPSNRTWHIQEVHSVLGHALCISLEVLTRMDRDS